MVTVINFLIVIIFIVSIFLMCCFGAKEFAKHIIETWKNFFNDERDNEEIRLYLSKCNLCKKEFIFTSKSDVKMNKIVKDGETITLCSDCYEKLFNNNHEKKEVVVDKRLKELLGKIKSD